MTRGREDNGVRTGRREVKSGTDIAVRDGTPQAAGGTRHDRCGSDGSIDAAARVQRRRDNDASIGVWSAGRRRLVIIKTLVEEN